VPYDSNIAYLPREPNNQHMGPYPGTHYQPVHSTKWSSQDVRTAAYYPHESSPATDIHAGPATHRSAARGTPVTAQRRWISDKLPNPLTCHPVSFSHHTPQKAIAVSPVASQPKDLEPFPKYVDPFLYPPTEPSPIDNSGFFFPAQYLVAPAPPAQQPVSAGAVASPAVCDPQLIEQQSFLDPQASSFVLSPRMQRVSQWAATSAFARVPPGLPPTSSISREASLEREASRRLATSDRLSHRQVKRHAEGPSEEGHFELRTTGSGSSYNAEDSKKSFEAYRASSRGVKPRVSKSQKVNTHPTSFEEAGSLLENTADNKAGQAEHHPTGWCL
jgi:hypothetical protein